MTANEMLELVRIKYDALFEFAAPAYSDSLISVILTDSQLKVFLDEYDPAKKVNGFESNERRRRNLDQLISGASISGTGTTGSISYTGNTALGSNIITSLNSTIGINIGIAITGSGIPASSTIISIISPTSIRISNNATATATAVALTSGLGRSLDQGDIHPNGVLLDMPNDFQFIIEESSVISYVVGNTTITTGEIKSRPTTHDEYIINVANPYKRPYSKLTWRMDYKAYSSPYGLTSGSSKRIEVITDGSSLIKYRIRYLKTPPDIVCDESIPINQRHCILDESLHPRIVNEAVKIMAAASSQEEYQIKRIESLEG